ncbi:putative polyketide synthase [Diaporthe ampelina]|uniref:Putative polyketide synthase n=1 Tax=Diaporthe ampelina TaxID=1214573 RepID=A0A0G2HDE7_9PEZI|nr:putative polyketide synthase [Diaporthe ampelina]
MDEHFQCLMDWALNHVLPRIESGLHPRVKAEWKEDTPQMVALWKAHFRGKIDMDLITALGEALPAVCRGTLPTLQVLMENDMLNRFYKEGLGFPQANLHLASLVSRFSHRYPHIKVLEIGAGTGGATAHVLKALSPQFESYTYTDISPGFFENARSLFHEYLPKMTFKTLDVERDPVNQGYEEESFDLIIASNVLHATKILANTLRNCRRLLKPGGQLLLMEITSAEETVRLGFITAGLPGWWLGRADGRIHAPTISEAQWHCILAENGFSGVDVARRDFEECHYNTVMATQAVDDRVAILREPLSMRNASDAGTSLVPHISRLVIVGGRNEPQNAIIRNLHKLLQPFTSDVLAVDSLEDLSAECFTPGTVSLCLADWDEPVWKDMTEPKFYGMKNMFLGSSHILWATRGRLADEPYSNMTVGMGRSFLLENPHVSLQFLDLDRIGLTEDESVALAESLLRMICLSSPEFDGVLWSAEHELYVKEGRTYIPRILPDDDLNNRLNADTRPIQKDISLLNSCVEASQQDTQLALFESEEHINCAGPQGSCGNNFVRVHVSSLFPFTTRDHQAFFVCVGSEFDSDSKFLFLSRSNASVVCAPPDQRVEWDSKLSDGEALNEVLTNLIAENLMFGVDGSLWVHEADDQLAKSLVQCSKNQGRGLFLSTTSSQSDPMRCFIHPRTPVRDLPNILPAGLTRYACAGSQNADDFGNVVKYLGKDGTAEVHRLMNNDRVLAPKVRGSKNLDDLFHSTNLEFFVLFSSIASVVGSKGQSNYGAANLFMHSIARQRRNRGVAASVVDIAMLLGVGYVARSLDQYESQMKQYSYMAISEPEFHNIFAAAILDPRFSHYVCHEKKSTEIAEAVHSAGNVLSQLAQSESSEGLSIMESAFSSKVELMLQLEPGSIDVQAPLVRVGIDSLVAVELRSWFLRELHIDMPVLKFLNGASVSDVCKDALARLSTSSRAQKATGNSMEGDNSPVSETASLCSDTLPDTGTTTPDNEVSDMTAKPLPYERIGPMSIGQTRLFFLQEYSQKKSAYTVIMLGKAQNTVDITKLQNALDAVARKHESLRSAFYIDKSSGKFVQAVTNTSGISLEHNILTGPEDLAAVVEAHKTFEFDLANGQTIKFMVLSESPTSQYILICYHHIVLDGFSSIMFLRDLDEAYSGRTLVPPAQQAIDLCVKQRLVRVPCNLGDELHYWAKIHNTPAKTLPLMPFSKVRNRQILRKFDVVWHDVIFDAEVTRRVKAVGTRLGVTPFQIYLSTLAAFLSRCLDVDDLNIGVMDSNRLDTEDLETFGYFMNFLPLRFSVSPGSSFSSFARQTRDSMYDALANSRAPLATIIDHLKVPSFGDVPIEWLDGTNLGYPSISTGRLTRKEW